MRTELFPLTISQEEYDEGVDASVLDGRTSEIMEVFHKQFLNQGLFYDVFQLDKNDEIFQDVASQVRSEYNEYVMRIVAIVVLEPGIDYLDTEFEEFYDRTREKFVPYSKYRH